MNPIEFVVAGDAVPLQSFRYSRKGSYQSPRVRAWQNEVAWAARQAYQGEPWPNKIVLTLKFRLSHQRRVDCDNLSKAVADSLTGIVYKDDCQIVDLRITKVQGVADPCTFVVVEFLEPDAVPPRRRKVISRAAAARRSACR